MKRTKLKDRKLPKFSRKEEIMHMVSHIVGGSIGVVALVLCLVFSIIHKSEYAIASSLVFGLSMIGLYTISSVYHGLKHTKAKKVLQIIDHCSIFVLIAGTYTPFLLCALRKVDLVMAWVLFGVVWGMAILGIVLNSIDLKKYNVFSMICYLVMGWCIIIKSPDMFEVLTFYGTLLLVLGGIFYTFGAILYGIGSKKKYFHFIFHIFVDIGSLLHFLCILLYVI